MTAMTIKSFVFFLLFTASVVTPVMADKPYDIRIAVASNFYATLNELVSAFEQEHDYTVSLSTGSSGVLSAQILRGAPFALFFSADQERVDMLVTEAMIEESATANFAQGRLLLVAKVSEGFENSLPWCGLTEQGLISGKTPTKMAIAKPELAPYGKASFALLHKQFPNSMAKQQISLVYGNNVAQVGQYVSEGAVDYAWVAVSMKKQLQAQLENFCFYEPNIDSYPAIFQKMALLQTNNSAALAFWKFMQSEQAKKIISEAGYVARDNK